MRLRSSQFVFLLLLACSVQVREDYPLRWAASAIAGAPMRAVQSDQTAPVATRRFAAVLRPQSFHLSPAARTAHRTAWTVPQPASATASIASHTSFIRA